MCGVVVVVSYRSTTLSHNPEQHDLNLHLLQNLKSRIKFTTSCEVTFSIIHYIIFIQLSRYLSPLSYKFSNKNLAYYVLKVFSTVFYMSYPHNFSCFHYLTYIR